MSSKQIGEPTEEINILLRRTAVPKCDITPAVKGLKDHTPDGTKIDSWKNFIREHQMQKISNQIASV